MSFPKGKDDGTTKLQKLPARREVVIHFLLVNLERESQVSKATIVLMHGRNMPIMWDMLYKQNVGRDCKVEKAKRLLLELWGAIGNFCTVRQDVILWDSSRCLTN